jgi:hypothetical protein
MAGVRSLGGRVTPRVSAMLERLDTELRLADVVCKNDALLRTSALRLHIKATLDAVEILRRKK